MWQDESLTERFLTEHTLPTRARTLAEFNANAAINISDLGVYPYEMGKEPIGAYTEQDPDWILHEDLEELPSRLIDNANDKIKYYYSLSDCFRINRPRAGIIYPTFLTGQLVEGSSSVYLETYKTSKRPRYYMHDKNNQFKYWTSMNYENNILSGVSELTTVDGNEGYRIDNAAPFVVYEQEININKITIKMQTYNGEGATADEVTQNRFTPLVWRVEHLNQNEQWEILYKFTRADVVPTDGHVELAYGILPPFGYEDTFRLYGNLDYVEMLESIPTALRHTGMAYLVKNDQMYVWDNGMWVGQPYDIGWFVSNDEDIFEYRITDLVDTDYREFFITRGLRIVVSQMEQPGVPFELIELSPRLQVDVSDYVMDFSATKSLGFIEDLPIGELSKDIADITLINSDGAFSNNNPNSLITDYIGSTTKIIFYNEIGDLKEPLKAKLIPIKTYYTEDWESIEAGTGELKILIEDHFTFFENARTPELLMTNVSLTYIVSVLLDNIGYTNYKYLGFDETNDVMIPYFFTGPDKKLTDILIDLAKAARCAMYFDEYNDFIMASKEYLSGVNREYDFELTGSVNGEKLPNVLSASLDSATFFNDGDIEYSPKTIARGASSIDSGYYIGTKRTIGYLPTQLWSLKSDADNAYGSKVLNNSEFVLSSIILENDLDTRIPNYSRGEVRFNTFNAGNSVYFLARFGGYLYDAGEIIRYDAVEYNVPGYGLVWIESIDQWQKFNAILTFNNGIEPTGRIRIWTEVENGKVINHGRGYFNTTVVYHHAKIDNFWLNKGSYNALEMEYKLLFNPCDRINWDNYLLHENASMRWTGTGQGGIKAAPPTLYMQSGITATEDQRVKTSALVWRGPKMSEEKATRTINYYRKHFSGDKIKRIGTRMRIVGEPVDDDVSKQKPNGGVRLYGTESASGGLSWFTDNSRQGYFLEVVGMADDVNAGAEDCNNGNSYYHNIVCYKIISGRLQANSKQISIPIKLWGATIPLALDSGKFAAEDTANNDTFNVVDLEIEIINSNTFDIYLNGIRIGQAIDDLPKQGNSIIKRLPANKEFGVFIRGDSHVMFENVWAMDRQATSATDDIHPDIFGEVELSNRFEEIAIDDVFRRYSLPGFIQQSFLRNIVNEGDKYTIDYDEFGAILRECFIVDAKYTEAYPSFYARLLPTLESTPPFVISNEYLGPYGAEFVLFNTADKSIVIADGKATALTISGIVMNEESNYKITFDEFLEKYKNLTETQSIIKKIKYSRRNDGLSSFNIESGVYLQTLDAAESMMNWVVNYLTSELKRGDIEIFANPMLQLGDIVLVSSIRDAIVEPTRMVIDRIDYGYTETGPTMTLAVREVL